jgi:hypothetical protein
VLAAPPWPRADHQKLLVHVLHLPVEQFGFTPPWEVAASGPDAATAAAHQPAPAASTAALPMPTLGGMIQPPTVAGDYAAIMVAYRRLYASVRPTHLHAAVVEHTRLGAHLIAETTGVSHQIPSRTAGSRSPGTRPHRRPQRGSRPRPYDSSRHGRRDNPAAVGQTARAIATEQLRRSYTVDDTLNVQHPVTHLVSG